MSQGIKGGNSRAQQWRRFGIAQCVGYRRQCFDGSDHVLLIPSVVAYAGNFGVAAVKEASTPALDAGVVLSAMPADADALSPLPSDDLGAQFIDYPSHLVSRNPRILNSWPEAFFHKHIAMTNAASLHLDAYFSCTRVRNFTLDNFEIAAWLRNLCHFHWCYSNFGSCHNFSFEFSADIYFTMRPVGLIPSEQHVRVPERPIGHKLFFERVGTADGLSILQPPQWPAANTLGIFVLAGRLLRQTKISETGRTKWCESPLRL